MPRHAAGDGMDGVRDLDALRLEQVRELADVVLRLRDREAVARHEDDLVRVREHDGHVLGRRAPDAAAVARRHRGGRLRDLAERAEEDVRDRAVHRPRHHQGQQGSGCADEHPGHDQDVVLQLEAAERDGDARERVEQRDHDGHVRAADRKHEESAEGERRRDRDPEQPLVLDAGDESDPAAERAEEERAVDELLPRVGDRPAADQLLELRERDHRARERDRADQRGEHDAERDVGLRRAGRRQDPVQLGERDQRGSTAADAVEQRHHLRHRGHPHLARGDGAEAAADQHRDRDRPPARRADLDPRDDDRQHHPRRADLVAAPRVRRVGEEAQREDERRRS